MRSSARAESGGTHEGRLAVRRGEDRFRGMGQGELIRKQVGRPRQTNPLRELQALNDNLRSLGIKPPPSDARHVRKSVGPAQPRLSGGPGLSADV